MISFKEIAKLLSGESWESFVVRMNEEKAQSALEALVNDDEAMERMVREELPWQPYPVDESIVSGKTSDLSQQETK